MQRGAVCVRHEVGGFQFHCRLGKVLRDGVVQLDRKAGSLERLQAGFDPSALGGGDCAAAPNYLFATAKYCTTKKGCLLI